MVCLLHRNEINQFSQFSFEAIIAYCIFVKSNLKTIFFMNYFLWLIFDAKTLYSLKRNTIKPKDEIRKMNQI